VQALSELPTEIDFSAYRAQLGNRAVVDEIERRFKAFKPAAYDVARQVKAIEAFEAEAVRNAEETRETVKAQLVDLQKTLTNIEEARPFDELTVDEIAAAEPSIDQRTEQMVVKGRWAVPGYKEKFGDLAMI
jgi:predicted ribosome quality control (RQC) complex YloA/Tae2 family protein